MSVAFDLDAYLARIGHAGPCEADLATLRSLHALQPAAIPFENLDPLLGRPVSLDLPSLQAKLVGDRRGGYCFELNSLLAAALESVGFSVTRLAARVRWRAPPERPEGARVHMLLRVDVGDAAYLVDVGFGGRLSATPIRLDVEGEQQAAKDVLRLMRTGETSTLQARAAGEWGDLYRFTLEPQVAADYEVANWFTSTHPTSFFRGNLLAERLAAGSRVTLFNNRLTEVRENGRNEVRFLTDARDLADVLDREFDIAAPEDAELLWSRFPKG
jgi:N-hydroxyarylamine O-acetyltransferase